MEYADILYGITMEESGVSFHYKPNFVSLISVRLSLIFSLNLRYLHIYYI